jgi:hypothetical protein
MSAQNNKPFSILSLDGGGTWALIQVRILQQRYGEHAKGHAVLRNYDLVIGNSGGSLVMAAMCMNHPLSTIAQMFLNEDILQTIFVKRPLIYNTPVVNKFLPRFKTAKKVEGLRTQLRNEADQLSGEMLVTELPAKIGKPELQLIITCFDYDRERAVYFRSKKDSSMESGFIETTLGLPNPSRFKDVSLLHAVHGSSNAPVQFFDDPAAFPYSASGDTTNKRFWDGAVGGNNNPVAVGILEALANGAKREDIRVVSIGTAGNFYPLLYNQPGEPETEGEWLVKRGRDEKFFGDLIKMTSSVLSDPPDAASFIAYHLLELPYTKPNERLIRINPLVKPILDEPNNIWRKPGIDWADDDSEHLFKMDMAVTESENVALLDRLCTDFFKDKFDNQGIRIGGNRLQPILGHVKFSEALADWKKW